MCEGHQEIKIPVVVDSVVPSHTSLKELITHCPPQSKKPTPPPTPSTSQPLPTCRKPSWSAQALSCKGRSVVHSLKSWAVQSQGRERGIRKVAAARKAEGLQPVAAPAYLYYTFICDALGETKAGRQIRWQQPSGVSCGLISLG